jgi:redox-sensitive bicupin YhaK (pirin superfamily)
MGPFTINRYFPGHAVPGHQDHGYGALAAFDDATLGPGTLIGMHEHVNDEIVSYVAQGTMYHDDSIDTKLTIDRNRLMVMNAGRSFWHEERTRADDQGVRMLQIFIRPHTLNLEPLLQVHDLEPFIPCEWRLLVGPEGTEAPSFVRNDIILQDVSIPKGRVVPLVKKDGWDIQFYVFNGAITIEGEAFVTREGGFVGADHNLSIHATEDALVVAFLINPKAQVTRQGTVGR